jgi:hypothetical protein
MDYMARMCRRAFLLFAAATVPCPESGTPVRGRPTTTTHLPEASSLVLEGVRTATQSLGRRRSIHHDILLPGSDGCLVIRL